MLFQTVGQCVQRTRRSCELRQRAVEVRCRENPPVRRHRGRAASDRNASRRVRPARSACAPAALVEDPAPLQRVRDIDGENAKRIAAESGDPDLALLRWKAAWGLARSAMFGLCPLSDDARARLLDRLLDETQWPSGSDVAAQRGAPAAKTSRKKMKRAFAACGAAVARFVRSLLAVVLGRL